MNPDDDTWREIAGQYKTERQFASFNSLLLDSLVVDTVLSSSSPRPRILDFGAGTGDVAIALAPAASSLTAYEPTEAMRSQLEARCRDRTDIRVEATLEALLRLEPFDVTLCLNVLDHIEDLAESLTSLRRLTKAGGLFVMVVPHPLKDLGDWEKEKVGATWMYRYYRLDDYLREGVCVKTREDQMGNVVVSNVSSFHRTVSTYFRKVTEAGFTVSELSEPEPSPSSALDHPILYSKCSRIPYFLMLVCRAA